MYSASLQVNRETWPWFIFSDLNSLVEFLTDQYEEQSSPRAYFHVFMKFLRWNAFHVSLFWLLQFTNRVPPINIWTMSLFNIHSVCTRYVCPSFCWSISWEPYSVHLVCVDVVIHFWAGCIKNGWGYAPFCENKP